MASRYCLKIYSELLGVLVSFCAFIWVIFHIFIMWQTSQSYNDDLRMARYLGKKSMAPINFRYYAHTYFSDICFGVLAFFSALALMYGAFVDSKTWLLVWTLGSMTGVVGKWVFYCYGKFSASQSHPEVVKPFETAGVVLTFIYLLLSLPVWIFQYKIEYWDLGSMCPQNVGWLCPNIITASMPIQSTRQGRCNHSQQNQGSATSSTSNRHYLPSYAECTTNTFLAPSNTHVNHLPASKGKTISFFQNF